MWSILSFCKFSFLLSFGIGTREFRSRKDLPAPLFLFQPQRHLIWWGHSSSPGTAFSKNSEWTTQGHHATHMHLPQPAPLYQTTSAPFGQALSVILPTLVQSITALPPTTLPCITLKPDITFRWAFPYVYPLTYHPLQVVMRMFSKQTSGLGREKRDKVRGEQR